VPVLLIPGINGVAHTSRERLIYPFEKGYSRFLMGKLEGSIKGEDFRG
jgi:hypothetical protein